MTTAISIHGVTSATIAPKKKRVDELDGQPYFVHEFVISHDGGNQTVITLFSNVDNVLNLASE